MQRINQLIEIGALTDPRYRKIELIEIATNHPAGYFNFFTERPQIFDAAYHKALEALEAHVTDVRSFRAGPSRYSESSAPT